MAISAEARGIDALLRDIMEMNTEAPEEIALGLQSIGGQIVAAMEQYPPETEANQPPPPYYIRGVGKVRADGTIVPTSEQLGLHWEQQTRIGGNTIEHEISNEVSYASYTHGEPGREQAWFHTMRNWPPLLDVALGAVGEETGITTVYQGRAIDGDELERVAERLTRRFK